MAMMFISFYTSSMVISNLGALMVQTCAYFPLTALLCHAFGTLSPVETGIVIVELFIVGAVILRLAVHVFRYGSIEYGFKLGIAGTFRRSEPGHINGGRQ